MLRGIHPDQSSRLYQAKALLCCLHFTWTFELFQPAHVFDHIHCVCLCVCDDDSYVHITKSFLSCHEKAFSPSQDFDQQKRPWPQDQAVVPSFLMCSICINERHTPKPIIKTISKKNSLLPALYLDLWGAFRPTRTVTISACVWVYIFT